jgi:acyl carrier protein
MTASDRARALLAEALGLAATEIPEDARIGAAERWDSLAHARLLIGLEEILNRPLDPSETARIESLADVADVLAASV